jgi:hypothetical protein
MWKEREQYKCKQVVVLRSEGVILELIWVVQNNNRKVCDKSAAIYYISDLLLTLHISQKINTNLLAPEEHSYNITSWDSTMN